MPYKFNPFTGNLDYYQSGGGGGGGVSGIAPTTPNAIATWVDTGATTIQNSNTLVQASGAIEAQGFIGNRQVASTVTVPTNYTWITDSIEMQPGGFIIMSPASKIVIV